MNRDKPTPDGKERDADRNPPSDPRQADAGDDLATAPDHDVPNEEVIEKTLPEANADESDSE
jgi:hypothetical protein